MSDVPDEMWDLLNALCERRLTSAQAQRLEELVLSNPDARWQYLTYLNLHGTLYWDAVGGLGISKLPPELELPDDPTIVSPAPAAVPPRRQRTRIAAWTALSLVAALGMGLLWRQFSPVPNLPGDDAVAHQDGAPGLGDPTHLPVTRGPRQPVRLPVRDLEARPSQTGRVDVAEIEPAPGTPPADAEAPRSPVALINREIEAGWAAAGVTPSERADDSAWLRRVYLDLAGRIPTVDEARSFLADRRDTKRQTVVDRLLDGPEYPRHLTTKWMNLLVGRSSPPQVDRAALAKFLRTSFAANRGWDEIVTELVAAEGRSDENGAANFLIAHLNNQAVPATAITARLFLGEQKQCTQCHNHPFGQAKQSDFWEFNSFFLQTKTDVVVDRDPVTGAVMSQATELVSLPLGGPTFFETRNGLIQAVYPRYHGKEISPKPELNRRHELARLMVEEDGDQLARAFVNRMWQHFFGFGFTPQIDDMGPHSYESHPKLLAGLAAAFRESGFDVKLLVRWICLSEPYQLSSRFNESNAKDDPERGETPLFSRVYPQPLSVEELYDSFLVATKAHHHKASDWMAAEAQRQEWLKQFIVSFQTDENDEANTFEGTVTQALTLMNGPMMDKALDTNSGTFLSEVLRAPGGETEKIEQLCLAALSRTPTPRELAAMRKLLKKSGPGVEGYQDLFWALLNSNEFAAAY